MQDRSRAEQARALCRDFRESGLTQREFCERQGIAKSTFSYWLKKERRGSGEQPLVRVTPGRSGPGRTPGTVKIRVDDRVVIEIEGPLDTDELMKVLAAVGRL